MSRSSWLNPTLAAISERSAHEAADRYWDAVKAGEPPAVESLDPSLAATIRRLPSLDDAPDPDPVFAARLEGELLRHAGPIRLFSSSPDLRFPAAGSDRTAARHERPNLTRWTAMNIAAAAALLAIVVASTLVALWAGPLARLDRDRPSLVLAPGITDEKLLLQARFDAIPDGVLSATISRWVLQPGAEVDMGRPETSKAPAAYLVEAGTLSVLPDVSVPVTRADETTPTPVPEAAWTTLLPGDRMFVPEGVPSLWRNDGAHPVRILEATFASREIQPQPAGVLHYQVISEWPYATKPDRPVVMSVVDVTLHPRGSLPVERVPGLAMLKVESGRLVAIDVDDAGNPLPPLELGQATRFLGSFPPGRVFRSGNDEPVRLLLVIITDANPLGADA